MQADKLILLIEDDSAIQDGLRELLEGEGYVVRVADNGQIGLEMLDQIRPSVILLDMMMPVMDGYAFIQALARLKPKNAQSVPIVLITAAGDPKIKEPLVQAVLMKPLDIDYLLEVLSDFC